MVLRQQGGLTFYCIGISIDPYLTTGIPPVHSRQADYCARKAGKIKGWPNPITCMPMTIILTETQVQTIISDAKCQELWSLLQSVSSSEVLTNQDFIRYRREAERHVGQDDHLYRVQWVSATVNQRSILRAVE
jgi:hypothetical protein